LPGGLSPTRRDTAAIEQVTDAVSLLLERYAKYFPAHASDSRWYRSCEYEKR